VLLVTLVVTPVAYSLFDQIQRRSWWKATRLAPALRAAAEP
jgi:hypothetical protein